MIHVFRKSLGVPALLILMMLAACQQETQTMTQQDEAAIHASRAAVFGAFKAGDLDTVMAHFHPDVVQIPAYDMVLDGKQAVEENYRTTMSRFAISMDDTLENMSLGEDLATTHGTYTFTLTPKAGGSPIARRGRYMVIMKRWDGSPTGWATYRELVQPATD